MTNSSDSAAPIVIPDGGDIDLAHYGLTKREYFAALAMQGLCANSSFTWAINQDPQEEIAALAVAHADALIAALNND